MRTSSSRDDFKVKTKRTLCHRVGSLCSNPDCRRLTTGPHTEPDKHTGLGEASHIHGASPKGPRYLESQTEEERGGSGNGIWLCTYCAKLVDRDEERYPAILLREWRGTAEAAAQLEQARVAKASDFDALQQMSRELLAWPQGFPDERWLLRPQIQVLIDHAEQAPDQALMLLGPPGSGKSALLAKFAEEVRAHDWQLVAIKADQLPCAIHNHDAFKEHFGLSVPLAKLVHALSSTRRTVLVVDQLDALSNISDVYTERLSVLISLIGQVVHFENVAVVCSAREFDFHHDERFRRLSAKRVNLDPLQLGQVRDQLKTLRVNSDEWSPAFLELLRLPQWLKVVCELSQHGELTPSLTKHGLLEQMWAEAVPTNSPFSGANRAALEAVAAEIAEKEELWIPVARLDDGPHQDCIPRLLQAGIFRKNCAGLHVGFAHQTLYEFVRARSFVDKQSLAEFVFGKDESLFVRSVVNVALDYLRDVNKEKYITEFTKLWEGGRRGHLKLLLVEFLGSQIEPSGGEKRILAGILRDAKWSGIALRSVARSRGWFAHLKLGTLPGLMLAGHPESVIEVLRHGIAVDEPGVVQLLRAHWMHEPTRAERVIDVLSHCVSWSADAETLALNAITLASSSSAAPRAHVSLLIHRTQRRAPESAVRFLAKHLMGEFERTLKQVPKEAPKPPDDAHEALGIWFANHERHEPLHAFLGEAATLVDLDTLAALAPGAFLDSMLPWLVAILDRVAESDEGRVAYRNDSFFELRPGSEYPGEFGRAFRIAFECIAKSDPERFIGAVTRCSDFDLMTCHLALSYGLEVLGPSRPEVIVTYLCSDARRLALGDHCEPWERTAALIRSLGEATNDDLWLRLENAILSFAGVEPVSVGTPALRRLAGESNRAHRFQLLSAFPAARLSAAARALCEQESRVFSGREERSRPTLREVGSPMSQEQMAEAKDAHILRFLTGVPDSTGFDHPKRALEGGSIQAAREFAVFATKHPKRALGLLEGLKPGINEVPAGQCILALSQAAVGLEDVFTAIESLHQRGFGTVSFRVNVSEAVEKAIERKAQIPASIEHILRHWLFKSTWDKEYSGNAGTVRPPFLWSHGGTRSVPQGRYSIMEALTRTLGSREPPAWSDWLTLMEECSLSINDSHVWAGFLRRLAQLRNCDSARAQELIDQLFERMPELICTADSVVLLANVAHWVNPQLLEGWCRMLRQSAWEHSARAFGEMVGYLALSENMEWASHEVQQLLTSQSESNDELIGLCSSAAGLWGGPCRPAATDILATILDRKDVALCDPIVKALRSNEAIIDAHSIRALELLSGVPEAFVGPHADRALQWAGRFVHDAPEALFRLCCAIAGVLDANPEAKLRFLAGSNQLVTLALSFQRMPEFREQGLSLFDQLLELGVYGIPEALKAVDQPEVGQPFD